jgi:hypothetical protein
VRSKAPLTELVKRHRDLDRLLVDTRAGFVSDWEGSHPYVAGPGSSSFLTALSLWLLHEGYDELFYVPPIYYTLLFFLRLLRIRVRPVSGKQPFERGFRMNLPKRRSVLLISDPTWYAGTRLSCAAIEVIKNWQLPTDSTVIVDGSFQYMQWDGSRKERTSELEPNQTIRLMHRMRISKALRRVLRPLLLKTRRRFRM